MPYHLLSEPIRRYIRDKGWAEFRPIQAAAIQRMTLEREAHYILASKTASGKTEAAFLPILSNLDFSQNGVQVLYISPLIALINDQFERVEELCKYLDVQVTKWHGEANRTQKKKLLLEPSGIVLITPESIEALFVHQPQPLRKMFRQLKYVVIDEIHAFVGTDRGTQLKSLLFRLQAINEGKFHIVGLSATLGDYAQAKKFTGDAEHTKVLLDKAENEIDVDFRYFENYMPDLPLSLLKDLYRETKDHKTLIFPNTRGRAEEVAVSLKKISDKVGGHPHYYSHHSSIEKGLREYIENFAKSTLRESFCIACTSTLELGIDIGTVEQVVQIDATSSIASLIQRVGRSGRQAGQRSRLILYATYKWSLLQSLACWLLYREGFIEPPHTNPQPYDILLHQALSIAKEKLGIPLSKLADFLAANVAFSEIDKADMVEILQHATAGDMLEKLGNGELILGLTGEKFVNKRDFYSVFQSEESYRVIHAGTTIGEVPLSTQIEEGENILLSARMWRIEFIDHAARRIEVVPTNEGRKPLFSGSASNIHERLREKMFQILCTQTYFDFLDGASQQAIAELRADFLPFGVQDFKTERVVRWGEKKAQFYSFSSSRINRTLQLVFNAAGAKTTLDDYSSCLTVEATKPLFMRIWSELPMYLERIDTHIAKALRATPALLDFSKWGELLEEKYQIALLKNRHFDVEGTAVYWGVMRFLG